MSVLDLINRVFGRDIASRTVAKERLRLVLVHDRSSVSPQLMEHLKEDLLQVISQYMEIDPDGFDVTLQTDADQVALVANIPIRQMKRAWMRP